MNLISRTQNDPVSDLLGTGFAKFVSHPHEIDGLFKIVDSTIIFLAVQSRRPRQGNFRAFVAALKLQYDTISFWHVFNPTLEAALLRYGFAHTHVLEKTEKIPALIWTRK